MIKYLNDEYVNLTGNTIINNSQLTSMNLLVDAENTKFFNIFRGLKINELTPNIFFTHQSNGEERWDTLSNKYYNTPYLWWVIPLINKIDNPFELPEMGDNIRILRYEFIYGLLIEMRR